MAKRPRRNIRWSCHAAAKYRRWSERLAGFDVRRLDVARPVVEILAERLWVAWHHAGVVNPDRLVAAVVVYDHLVGTHDRRPPQLAGCEPGQLDVSDSAGVKLATD